MDTAGETVNSTSSMSSYSLRFQTDISYFLNVLNQLIEIYEEEDPRFFKLCVQSISVDIYDKIVELNGSKRQSKHWSIGYMKCITLSKQLIFALNSIERNETLIYHMKIHHYEHHFGDTPRETYTISISPVPEFEE